MDRNISSYSIITVVHNMPATLVFKAAMQICLRGTVKRFGILHKFKSIIILRRIFNIISFRIDYTNWKNCGRTAEQTGNIAISREWYVLKI